MSMTSQIGTIKFREKSLDNCKDILLNTAALPRKRILTAKADRYKLSEKLPNIEDKHKHNISIT